VETCEERLIHTLKKVQAGPVMSLPCEKIRGLLSIIDKEFLHIGLTREEEGVGISAGAALAGKRPCMFVQSSGMGNMLNALMSLTKTYSLPLSIFVSWRGVYNEKIQAQVPLGRALQGVLDACGISHTVLEKEEDLSLLEERLSMVYEKKEIHVFLMSPLLWNGGTSGTPETQREVPLMRNIQRPLRKFFRRYTRFDFIEALASILNGEVVVSNLGIPSKELFYIRHRPLNFYMLGSMGMATAIGTGLSLFTDRRVIAIDGDGSLLMNPGTLGTVASLSPENLFVVAIDNGSYGSTGDQPTLSSRCVDLEAVARAFGIMRTQKTDSPRELVKILRNKKKGPFFIHVIARPGNKEVPDIPLTPLEIRELFSNALLQDGSP
jgi:sulfopyruvate decarboxylase beta subunit